MNFGKTIQELRKKKNVTQDEMAAELGVTAAAVSKWENNYTLPDILMLCALADYFQVTTDELLGRNKEEEYAVIVASSKKLAEQIKSIAAANHIITKAVFDNEQDASAAIRKDQEITYLIAGFLGNKFPEFQFDTGDRAISLYMSVSNMEQTILDELQHALQNRK